MAREDIRAFLLPAFDAFLFYSGTPDIDEFFDSFQELEGRALSLACQTAHYSNQRILLHPDNLARKSTTTTEYEFNIHSLSSVRHSEVLIAWRLMYGLIGRLYSFWKRAIDNYLDNTDEILERIANNTYTLLEVEGLNRKDVLHDTDCPGEKYDTVCHCQLRYLLTQSIMQGKPLTEVAPEQAKRYSSELDALIRPYLSEGLEQLFRQRAIYEANVTLFLQSMMHILIDFSEWGPGKDSPYYTLFEGSNNYHITQDRIVPFIESAVEYRKKPTGVDQPSPYRCPPNFLSLIALNQPNEPHDPSRLTQEITIPELAMNPGLFDTDLDEFSVVDPAYQPDYATLLEHCLHFIPAISSVYYTTCTGRLSPPEKLSPHNQAPTMFIQPPHTVSVRERKTLPQSLTHQTHLEQTCASYLAGMLSQSKIPPEITRDTTRDLLWNPSEDFFTVAVAITHHPNSGNTLWVTTNWGYAYLPTGWNTVGANPYYHITPNSITTYAASLPPGEQIHHLLPFLPEGTTLLGVASNDPRDTTHIGPEIILHYFNTTGYPQPTIHPLLGLGYTTQGHHALEHLRLEQESHTTLTKLLWATETFQSDGSTAVQNLCHEYHNKAHEHSNNTSNTRGTTSEEYASMLCEELAEQARRYLPHLRASSYATKNEPMPTIHPNHHGIGNLDHGLRGEHRTQLERSEHLARTIKILDFLTQLPQSTSYDMLYTGITTQTHTPNTQTSTIETNTQQPIPRNKKQ